MLIDSRAGFSDPAFYYFPPHLNTPVPPGISYIKNLSVKIKSKILVKFFGLIQFF